MTARNFSAISISEFSGCDSVMKPFFGWISEHGERLLFSILGLVFLSFSIFGLWQRDITSASASFGLGFLSFIYANVARFKKFKGLGFEAELWEDKKKEAEHLIERLKAVVSIYTQEVVLSKVKAGRLGGSPEWEQRWKLYDELVQRHQDLGQTIDFSDLKRQVDAYFLFDMTMPQYQKCRQALQNAAQKAREVMSKKFGSPIVDNLGYNAEFQKLTAIKIELDNPLAISQRENLAEHLLNVLIGAKEAFDRDFGVHLQIDSDVLDRLAIISRLYESRPVQVTPQLIGWADRVDTKN